VRRPPSVDAPFRALPEREVLSLVTNGMSNPGYRASTVSDRNSVHRHLTSVMRKLALRNRMDVLRYCLQRGQVEA
jgi:DNA-binding NarL/FixJ family response regulator